MGGTGNVAVEKVEKIKWHDQISNDEVLTIVNESRCLIRIIGERKKNSIGHVLRGDGLLRDVLEEECLIVDRGVDQGWI